jgi:F0F1-type ATP synthase assembly protein I
MSGGNDPVKVYQAQAAGEGFKFLLTLVGFALVFLGYKEVAGIAALSWLRINLCHLLAGIAEATLG